MKRLAWAALLVLLCGAEASMCGAPPCTPQNCTGCCDEADTCHPGTEVSACGLEGAACVSCLPGICAGDGLCFGTGTPPDADEFDGSLTFPDGGRRDAGLVDAGPSDAGLADAGADAGATDAGVVDAGPADSGIADAGLADAGAPDAGPRDAGSTVPGIRFANFSNQTLDFCVWNNGSPVPAQPAFFPTGIGPGEVSAYFPFAGMTVNFNFLMVPVGVGCALDAGFNPQVQPGNSAPHRTRWYTGTGSPLAGGMLDDAPLDPTGDVVLFERMLSINASLTFVPIDDGGIDAGPLVIMPGAATLIPAGLVGQLNGNVPARGTPTRPYVSLDGGLLRAFLTGAEVVICDTLAPPIGILSDCRPTVRAP